MLKRCVGLSILNRRFFCYECHYRFGRQNYTRSTCVAYLASGVTCRLEDWLTMVVEVFCDIEGWRRKDRSVWGYLELYNRDIWLCFRWAKFALVPSISEWRPRILCERARDLIANGPHGFLAGWWLVWAKKPCRMKPNKSFATLPIYQALSSWNACKLEGQQWQMTADFTELGWIREIGQRCNDVHRTIMLSIRMWIIPKKHSFIKASLLWQSTQTYLGAPWSLMQILNLKTVWLWYVPGELSTRN